MRIIRRIIRKLLGRTGFDTSCFQVFGTNSHISAPLSIFHPECVEIGNDTNIMQGARLDCWPSYEGVKLKPRLVIGDRTQLGLNFTAICSDDLCIGDDVLIAGGVIITTQNHGMDPESEKSYQRQPPISAPVRIGNGCWIGERAVILPGVTIGEKAIIGANSVVTKDIPGYSIAVGMPAKVVKVWDFEQHCWVKPADHQ
jgi:lipopolysaccharide O-acetyltransferase